MAVAEKSSDQLLKDQSHIWNQIFSFQNSASLKCAVQLGIADVVHKHGKPMTISELSSSLPINPSKAQYIKRLMRVLVNSGFFVEQRFADPYQMDDNARGYALTPAGCLLLKEEPMNAREMVLTVLDPRIVKPWNVLSEWFQNDDPTSFHTVHGKNLWDFIAEQPRLGNLFNEAMTGDSQLIAKMLITELRFVFEGLTSMVDVGGGTGTVCRAIAKDFPSLKCTVFDLPHVVADLQEPMENLDFLAGDMFEKIPNANAILLKWILHDWNDENCLKILKNCKKAIPEKEKGGKVIIIDMVMDRQKQDNESVEAQLGFDMQMLVILCAKERTEEEWAALFRESGFSGYKVFPVLGSRCLIEVYP